MHTAAIQWGYAVNHWKPGFMGFARREEHERAFKITAACGFRALELTAGSGRWDPLGRPDNIAGYYGSVAQFMAQLREWGIERIASVFYDPGSLSFEDLHHGLAATDRSHHEGILKTARLHAGFLAEVGGSCLVARPTPSHWRLGGLTPEQMRAVADCWRSVGTLTASLGVKTALHIDALSALRTTEDIDALLALLGDAPVWLALDTAELTIAGHDVVGLYRRHHERVAHFHFKDALAVDTLGEFRLHNAERAMIQAGGQRHIPRWFGELGAAQGLVDFPALMRALGELDYRGWIIVESDRGPQPVARDMMLNSWYVRRVLQQRIS